MNRIVVDNVSKSFKIGFTKRQGALAHFVSFFSGKEPKKTLWALRNISFKAKAGEIVGIIGENGSGKSTLLRIIAGIYEKDKGAVKTKGNVISLIGLYAGLQARLSMKDNIYLCCSLFGLDNKTINIRFNSIVKFTKLEDFTSTKIYQFSQGMKQRLAFAIAIHCDPEILLLDEVFEIGDEDFKKKSSKKIIGLVKKGATALIVSHDTKIITKYCQKVIWVDKIIVREGQPVYVIKKYIKAGVGKGRV